jgi:hypothetical protein
MEENELTLEKNEIIEPAKKRSRKSKEDNEESEKETFEIPNLETFLQVNKSKHKYSLPHLKSICKHYKLKVTGTKPVLFDRIFDYLWGSFHAIKIQKVARGYLQRLLIFYQGPAFFKRNICVNETDFITMEPVNEIAYDQFVSYEEKEKVVYGFDIVSLYNMLIEDRKQGKKIVNPYNRSQFLDHFLKNCKRVLQINKAMKRPLNLVIDNEDTHQTLQQQIEMRALNLFQLINSYGHYSDSKWLLNLERNLIQRFVLELMELWNYRLNMSTATKRQICPPDGNPFRNIHIMQTADMSELRRQALDVVERMVNSANSVENKNLGAFYVLGSLTLVSPDAATAMPWLRESFF